MTERHLGTALVWAISLTLIGCGFFGLFAEYADYHVSSVTVDELGKIHPEKGNFRIADGFLDYANAVDSKDGDEAYVPVRSRGNPTAPIAVVLTFPFEKSSGLKKHPNDVDLIGQVWEADKDLPKAKVAYASHVVVFSTSLIQPYGPKLIGDILLFVGPMLLGISFILMNAGIGKRSIGSLFRCKPPRPET